MAKKNHLILSIFLSFSNLFFAQFADFNGYVTRIWNSADNLPGNSITDIIQSKDGFMYFGTYEGLVKFDGKDFIVENKYSNENFEFVSARSIFEDSNGVIWVGSNDEGIQKISKKDFYKINTNLKDNVYNVQNGIESNSIRAFAEDSNRNLWIGTSSGISCIDKSGNVKNSLLFDEINSKHMTINQLYCDSADRIWLLGNDNNAIYITSDEKFKRYEDLDFIGDYIPSAISQDQFGNFWVALSQNGIYRINNGFVSKVITNTILDYKTTQSIYCDKNGTIWFGTENGLVLYADGVFVQYTENNAIANSSIQKINGDREGNIWVATSTGGIGKISSGKFKTYKLNTAVNAICEDKDGLIWIGADDGLHCFANEKELENNLTDFCKDIRIRHVELTENGDLLVNAYTSPALIRYNGKEILYWTTDEGLAGNRTRVSIESKDSYIYCGTTTGLSIIDSEGEIENIKIENGINSEYIMCIYEDKNGFVWVGTDGGGIFILDNHQVVHSITADEGLAGNVIFKITQDKDDNYWICTGSGISKIKFENYSDVTGKNTITNFTSGCGLGSDAIFQIIDDGNGNFWMVSNRGISSAKISDFDEVASGSKKFLDCKFYNQNDGLKSTGANSTALSMKDRYGRIWFTLADGFAVYDPVKSKSSHVLPIVQLEEVKIDDNLYYDFSKEIIIPAGTKHVDIKFAGLSFTACERNRFIYKMEGFDDEFSEPTASCKVSYTNLKPGKYVFEVNVLNGEEDFSDRPATAIFIQKAFFWQLPIFWISLSVCIIAIIFIIFFVIISTNKKKQLILETKIQMATVDLQIARDESDSLLRNILPDKIAEELKGIKTENRTIAQRHENVTVLFSDIVGFTNTTGKHTAEEVVSSLNELVSRFDKTAKRLHVEKIKTIGDAYMAVCGAPNANSKHSEIMLKFASEMYKDLYEYNKTAKIRFKIRIGLNSGPVIAGVIGTNKFIYDIWGDTVNVASRMESNCNPMHIRMTEAVVKNLEAHGYHYNYRVEEVDVKGKGLMKTYELPNK